MNPASAIPPTTAQQALELRDIHLPVSPEWWPPAPGWWLLAIVVISLLLWLFVLLRRYWQRKQWRKTMNALLEELSQRKDEMGSADFLTSVSTLLRRVALLQFPRAEVASLTGRQWLFFLDQHGGGGEFVEGAGQVLESGPYARDSEVDKDGLLLLAKKWIKRNSR